MAKQLKLPIGQGTSRQFARPREATAGAQAYAAQQGMAFSTKGLDTAQADAPMAYTVGAVYDRAMKAGDTDTPELRQSYEAMRKHVGQQFDFLTRPKEAGGMGVKVNAVDNDPYPNGPAGFKAMRKDLKRGEFNVLATRVTGSHAVFSDEENDQFRAVHDVFGHLALGRGFSRHGEEAAFKAHRQMFPPEAHAALATETRGQNSYMTAYSGGQFADQDKLVGLPTWATKDDISGGAPTPKKKRTPKPKQGKLF